MSSEGDEGGRGTMKRGACEAERAFEIQMSSTWDELGATEKFDIWRVLGIGEGRGEGMKNRGRTRYP